MNSVVILLEALFGMNLSDNCWVVRIVCNKFFCNSKLMNTLIIVGKYCLQ